LINHAKRSGVKVLFDIDDLVFNPDYVHLVVDTLDQNNDHDATWDTWYADFARHGAVLKLCDAAITTNRYLAQLLHEYTPVPVFIIPNFLNRDQLDVSRDLYLQKVKSGFTRDSRIHLGYFSGTPTHNKDFDLASNAIVELLEADPRIVVRIAGFMDIRGPLSAFGSRIDVWPLTDFMNLQRLIGAVEINLVPLQDNVFTNCKSELKYFEAAIVGTVSVATPTFTLKNAIRDNVNGLLARSWEWKYKLEEAIDGLSNHRYQHLAETAFDDSRRRYSPEAQVDLIESILFQSTTALSSGLAELEGMGRTERRD
jgi:glycosyltransferase involved in cell wall biosynthesis